MAYEALHSMHIRKKGKTGSLALKLDVNKAYGSSQMVIFTGSNAEVRISKKVD